METGDCLCPALFDPHEGAHADEGDSSEHHAAVEIVGKGGAHNGLQD